MSRKVKGNNFGFIGLELYKMAYRETCEAKMCLDCAKNSIVGLLKKWNKRAGYELNITVSKII